MRVRESRLTLRTDPPARGDPDWVRGFFANLFSDNPLFGNHDATGGNLFVFPRVQYRIAEGAVVVLGLMEGAETLEEIRISPKHLRLGRREHLVLGIHRESREVEIGIAPGPCSYRFVSPWMPLNQENHLRYAKSPEPERRRLLERILVGNLLTLAKGVGETVLETIAIGGLTVHPRTRMVKKQPMKVFDGTFSVNFLIPDDWGIGRGGARGFGVVRHWDGITPDVDAGTEGSDG
ncbi:MAG: CRISPR-associated endonuclease Cas6 [Candidatus Riflebacteria bacterium]|nr:CRISPR-associated endonuclease Cas6 [Candidatus Riflebacteria bacterium]